MNRSIFNFLSRLLKKYNRKKIQIWSLSGHCIFLYVIFININQLKILFSKTKITQKKSRSISRSRSRSYEKERYHKPGYGLIKRRENDDKNQREETKSAKQLEIEKLKKDIERMKNKRFFFHLINKFILFYFSKIILQFE